MRCFRVVRASGRSRSRKATARESSMPLTDNYIFELDEFFTENLASPSSEAVRELVGSTS